MAESMIGELEGLGQSWTRAMTSLVWGQWLMLDTGFKATQTILATAAPGGSAGVKRAEMNSESHCFLL